MPWPAIAQSFITIGVLVLLWSLHSRLADRPVFRWWAWAWTSYGLNLGAATLAGRLGLEWSFPRATLVILTAIFGFLTSLFLIFGARSMVSTDLPTRFQRRAGTLLAITAAIVTVLVSLAWSPATFSYHARLAPRTLALAAALFYCAWVFISLWKRNSSPASLITGIVCFVHGLTQGIYGLAVAGNVSDIAIIQPAVDAIISWRWALFWVELVNVYGSCIGLLLVFAEDYHRAQQALSESLDQRREVTGENLALQQEIETRRRAEDALQRSEEKFAAAFRSNPCAMAITLLENGHILDVNDVCIRQSGYRSEELIGKTAEALGIWADQKDRASVRAELETHGRVATREVKWRTKAGSVLTVLYSADTIEIDGRRCVLSVGEDITARKQAEATHRAVLRALPDWIFVMSESGVFLDFHVKDPERLAVPPDQFMGKHIREILPPDVAEALVKCFGRAMASEDTATIEYSIGSLDDLSFFEARVVRCDVDKVLAIVRDVTERRRAERQARELRDELAHVGRITTLAALTGSLAHEINQPLAAIMTNAQAARRLLDAPVPDLLELRAALADIVSDNQRAAEVVRRLRTLLRKDTSEYARVDLNDSINDVIKVLQGDITSRGVKIDVELAGDLPGVLGDRIQLQQVILNLLLNAFEALEQEDPSARRVRLRTSALEGTVTVSVTDVGVGLTDEQLPRMFEPFYTTKPDGMGLGLAICQTIMNAHDGAVGVERNAHKGTTFSFTLPTHTADAVAIGAATGERSLTPP
jgi:PAS domain S-box-containing protein